MVAEERSVVTGEPMVLFDTSLENASPDDVSEYIELRFVFVEVIDEPRVAVRVTPYGEGKAERL